MDTLPEEVVYRAGQDSGFAVVMCSACMIKGHFPNACYEEFLKVLVPGGFFVFSIRDIYLDPATDNGMDFVGKLASLTEAGRIKHLKTLKYTKYKGLQFGSGHQEEPANIMIYQKLE